MQYTIIVNQLKAVEWGLNAAQAALMAFVYELESWGDDVVQDEFAYKWISKHKVIDELPLYFSKTDTVHRNLIDLEKKGLIVRNFTSKRSLVKLTVKGREWRITSDLNPTKVGNKSYPTSDLDPTDPSTNIIEPDPNKNTKKNGLDFSPLGFTDQQVSEWKELRKKAKAPVNQRAINLTAKEFEKSRQAGYSNDQILDILSDKGWKGYKHEWMLNATQSLGVQENGPYQGQAKEYNGIGYGEHADQSNFPDYLRIERNDMPDIKSVKTAMQLTFLKDGSE